MTFRVASAHEEGGAREYAINTECFVGEDGHVRSLRAHRVESVTVDGRPTFQKVDGSDVELPADYVFLAMGFVGPQGTGLLDDLGVDLDPRGNVARDATFATSVDGVFVCGDMGRGQSLIVWAISEGRSCASSVDRWLTGNTMLPAPITPTDVPLR
jgi:glutamate synthase (NADPH/NADH) small chain